MFRRPPAASVAKVERNALPPEIHKRYSGRRKRMGTLQRSPRGRVMLDKPLLALVQWPPSPDCLRSISSAGPLHLLFYGLWSVFSYFGASALIDGGTVQCSKASMF